MGGVGGSLRFLFVRVGGLGDGVVCGDWRLRRRRVLPGGGGCLRDRVLRVARRFVGAGDAGEDGVGCEDCVGEEGGV